MMGVAVVTIPEGMVKRPESCLPKNSILNVLGSRGWGSGVEVAALYWFARVHTSASRSNCTRDNPSVSLGSERG